MRYDTPMYPLVNNGTSYSYESGDYDDAEISEKAVMASIISMPDDVMRWLFGELKRDCLIAHTPKNYHQSNGLELEKVQIGTKFYKVVKMRRLRRKCVYYLQRIS